MIKKASIPYYSSITGNRIGFPDYGFKYKPKSRFSVFPLPKPHRDVLKVGEMNVDIVYPEVERSLTFPRFSIETGVNPNKATVFHKTGKVLFDSDFIKTLPFYQILFVILHERGHEHYKTEWKCDAFAYQEMIRMGFPDSVILNAALKSRGDKIKKIHRNLAKFIKQNKNGRY